MNRTCVFFHRERISTGRILPDHIFPLPLLCSLRSDIICSTCSKWLVARTPLPRFGQMALSSAGACATQVGLWFSREMIAWSCCRKDATWARAIEKLAAKLRTNEEWTNPVWHDLLVILYFLYSFLGFWHQWKDNSFLVSSLGNEFRTLKFSLVPIVLTS